MKTNILLLTVLSVPLFGACTILTSRSPSEQFFDSCSGSYTCTGGGESASPILQKDGDSCDVGGIALSDDGTGTDSSGDAFTWSGDATSFDVCLQGACITCTPSAAQNETAPAPASTATPSATATASTSTPAPAKACSGKAVGCSLLNGGECDGQAGCSWSVGGAGSCRGTRQPCSVWLSQEACEVEIGCSWQ